MHPHGGMLRAAHHAGHSGMPAGAAPDGYPYRNPEPAAGDSSFAFAPQTTMSTMAPASPMPAPMSPAGPSTVPMAPLSPAAAQPVYQQQQAAMTAPGARTPSPPRDSRMPNKYQVAMATATAAAPPAATYPSVQPVPAGAAPANQPYYLTNALVSPSTSPDNTLGRYGACFFVAITHARHCTRIFQPHVTVYVQPAPCCT
jgi:hypothetical protein